MTNKNKQKSLKAARRPRGANAASATVRPSRKPPPRGHHYTIGIDPANETAGLTLLDKDGSLLWCGGDISAWDSMLPKDFEELLASIQSFKANERRCKVYYEFSAHTGSRSTSDSISRSAGMLIEKIRSRNSLVFDRKDVHGVPPSTWRKGVYGKGRPLDPKMMAIEYFMNKTGMVPKNHDMAESFLIAAYGYNKENKK